MKGLVNWVSSCYGSVFVRAAGQSCAYAAHSSSQSSGVTEREEIRGIVKRDRAEEEDSQELREEGCGFTYICSHRPTNSRVGTADT